MTSTSNFNEKSFEIFGIQMDTRDFYIFSERWLFSTNHKYIGTLIVIVIFFGIELTNCEDLILNSNYAIFFFSRFKWKKTFTFLLVLFLFVLITSLVVYYPLFGFLIGLLSSIGLIFLNIDLSYGKFNFSKFNARKNLFVQKFLNFLKDINLMEIFAYFYVFFYCVSPLRFYIYIGTISSLNIIYILFSRYNLLIKNFSYEFSFYENHIYIFYFLLYLGLFVIYLRLFLLLSFYIIQKALVINPILLDNTILYGIIPDGTQNSSSTVSPNTTPSRKFSLFHINYYNNRNYHKYFYDETFANMKRQRNIGFFIGIVGGLAGVFTAKFSWDQVNLNRDQLKVQQDGLKVQQDQLKVQQDQVRAQEVNNFEMAHQNDLTKVELGLMSKEDYNAKYSKN